MTENFLNLVKEIDIQTLEAQRIPNKRNPKRSTSRYIIIIVPIIKDKEKILKAARKSSQLPTRETLQARRNWHEIFSDEK